MNDKVSLIIPVYNVEPYIGRSLLSALNQTFDNIEYILVDDCGTDHSMDVICGILQGHPRAKDVHIVRHEKNSGLSAARNTGVIKATGKYIFFMDSDDEITPDCIEKHYQAITQSKADFTIANVILVGAKSIHIKNVPKECLSSDVFSTFLKRKWSVNAWNKLYLRSFLIDKSLSFQQGLIFEDILWSYSLCLHTDKVAWVLDKTYFYKIRKNSITASKNSPLKIESLLFILNKMISDWENKIINHRYKKEFAFMINFYRLNAALLLLNYAGSKREAASYYRQLNFSRLASLHIFSFQSITLKLPFFVFRIIMLPVYSLYKFLNR